MTQLAHTLSGKGVRQGDPLSPFLFNIAADVLAKMIGMAQNDHLVKGLFPEYVDNGVAILQYADDTILCLQDIENAINMKLLLYLYEEMSGLKINFMKIEIIMVSQESEMFNCSIGAWPIKHPGVPVSGSKLHVADWVPLDAKLLKRLDSWQGSSLTIGGRTILIQACVSNMPIY